MLKLKIGIDFDNTLICYDEVFFNLAFNRGWLEEDHSKSKAEVKKTVTRKFDDDHWQELQALAYGSEEILKAELFPNALEFLETYKNTNVELFIISHKSKNSHKDPTKDLHKWALSWLDKNNLSKFIKNDQIFFCPTLEDKVIKVRELGCDIFIDDLEKVFDSCNFPENCLQILFDQNWKEVLEIVNKVRLVLDKLSFSIVELKPTFKGGNNKVNIAKDESGKKLLIKEYSYDKDDFKDRYAKESSAYNLLLKNNFDQIPKQLFFDSENKLGCFEYIDGEDFNEAHLNPTSIDQILNFVLSLEKLSAKINLSNYHPATDGRGRLKDYTDTIEKRISSIEVGLNKNSKTLKAFENIFKEVKELKNSVFSSFLKSAEKLSLDIESKFKDEELILSPSDFGFHNMKILGNKVFFFDFEYFGVDDPAKLWADFYHHVGFNLNQDERMMLISKYMNLTQNEKFKIRFNLILDIVGLEWILIVLNICDEDVLARRLFSNPSESIETLIEKRRALVEPMIKQLKQKIG